MSVCENKDAFQPLVVYTNANKTVQNSTIEEDVAEAETLYSNAKFYYTNNEFSGALVSYSCAAVLLNSIVRQLPKESPQQKSASEILNCCLSAVQILQDKVKSSSGSSGSSKDDEKKDWGKICTNLQPLVFSKGSSDCLFFSSVAGLRKEKELFRSSLIFPLSYPNLYPKASKGILIYGPPGTGKTYIVKAAVNELQKTDPKVGVLFFAPSPGDLKGKYVGETEKKIEEWFTCASRAACESQLGCPNEKKFISLVFMDEFDAIAPDRNTDTTGLAANSVNTLLQMMDGINSKENVAIVAATNYPWNLDSAILRRFDTQILIDLPKKMDIRELLNIEMKKIIKFREVKDPNAFCLSEEKKNSSNDSSANKKNTSLICNLECIEEVPIDLTTTKPYNQMVFDFYSDASNNGSFVTGLVQLLEDKHFSNSDISRLIKAAATYTGQLCVKNNLFYSSRMLLDYTGEEKYISTMTKLKNEDMSIVYSLRILKSYMNPIRNPFPPDIYQLVKPKFVKINYGADQFINVKCLFYKDNALNIDDPQIKDVYIKLDVNFDDVSVYKEQVVNNKEFDAIIVFDFSIKESNSTFETELNLPVSTILINSVFKPIYNIFQDVKKTIEEFEMASMNLTEVQIAEKIAKLKGNIEKSKEVNESYNIARKSYVKSVTENLLNRIKSLEEQLTIIPKATTQEVLDVVAEYHRNKAQAPVVIAPVVNAPVVIAPAAAPVVNAPVVNAPVVNAPVPVIGGGKAEALAWAAKKYNLNKQDIDIINKNMMFNIDTSSPDKTFFTSPLKNILTTPNLALIKGEASKMINNFSLNNYNFYSYILLFKVISDYNTKFKQEQELDKSQPVQTQQDKSQPVQTQQDKSQQDKSQQDKSQQDKSQPVQTQQDKSQQDKSQPVQTQQDKSQPALPTIIESEEEKEGGAGGTVPFKYVLKTNDKNIISNINFYLTSISGCEKTALSNRDIQKELTDYDYNSENNKQNILPFPIVNTFNNTETIILLDIVKNVFLLTIEQYKDFIPNFEFYTLGLYNNLSDVKNFYIEIETSFFMVVFKNCINVSEIKSTYKSKSKTELKEKEFNSNTDYYDKDQCLIQLYLNDVYNFYYLCKSMDETDNEILKNKGKSSDYDAKTNDILNKYLKGYLSLKRDTISLLELICMRIHNNFDFVSFNKRYVLSEKVDYDKLWKGEDGDDDNDDDYAEINEDINPDADDEDSADEEFFDTVEPKGGYKKKNIKLKYNKKNNTSVKNKSVKNKTCKTRSNNKIQYGGTKFDDDEYYALIGFCLGTSELQTTKKIINKRIYVKTTIDLAKFIEQKRSGLLIGFWGGLKSFTKKWKDYFMNKTESDKENDEAQERAQMLVELKNKGQYLPLIFKEIEAIGFLTDNTKTVKDDDDIDDKKHKIEWIEIASSKSLLDIFSWIRETFNSMTLGLVGGVGKALEFVTLGAVGSGAIVKILDYIFGSQLMGSIITILSTGVGKIGQLWSAITGYFGSAAVVAEVSVEGAVEGAAQVAAATAQTWGAYGMLVLQRLNLFITLIYTAIEIKDFVLIKDVDAGRILNSLFLKAIFTMVTDTRSITVSSLENTSASILFINSLKQDFFISAGFFIDMLKKIPFSEDFFTKIKGVLVENRKFKKETPKAYDIISYKNTATEPKDIKRRLTNLNIPFSAFSYALTTVQSTYVKETGEMLTQYYNNKDKFMEEYKKKIKKQSAS
jgi:SpoVK/Ycf46/Vps4 family AAA+-type ATPase